MQLQTSLLPTDQVVLDGGGDAKLLSLRRCSLSAGANVRVGSLSTSVAAEGSLSGQSIASLYVTSIASSDLVAINQGGAGSRHRISEFR